jgi:hypothetical protein
MGDNRVKIIKNSSIKVLVIYALAVFAVILLALVVRFFFLVSESKFDGKHRFTLAVVRNEKVLGLMSFEPISSTLALIVISSDKNLSFSKLGSAVGVIPDGYVKVKGISDLSDSPKSILQSIFLRWNSSESNITIYDLFQFWYYSNKVSSGSIYNQKITNLSDKDDLDKTIRLLLSDSLILSENISIQVINASEESGLGKRLERVISNFGGNVVSIDTSLKKEKISRIQFYDKESYTSKKLFSLLKFKQNRLKTKTIAEIVIILGSDLKDTKLF